MLKIGVKDVIWRLAELASLPFQERYLCCATADEYILDNELLGNVLEIKERLRANDPGDYSDAQRAALDDLFLCIETHADAALSGTSQENMAVLIRESDAWKQMRLAAAAAIRAFGISPDLTVEEINRLSE